MALRKLVLGQRANSRVERAKNLNSRGSSLVHVPSLYQVANQLSASCLVLQTNKQHRDTGENTTSLAEIIIDNLTYTISFCAVIYFLIITDNTFERTGNKETLIIGLRE